MSIKKMLLSICVFAITTVFLTTTAFAGSTQRHRWEGVAIGIGVALLGSAIIHQHKISRHPGPVPNGPFMDKKPPFRHKKYEGYWEFRDTYIPPTYKKVWNPDHYDVHGNWVEGHWIEIVDKEGYWTRERVWVSRR